MLSGVTRQDSLQEPRAQGEPQKTGSNIHARHTGHTRLRLGVRPTSKRWEVRISKVARYVKEWEAN
jgi:hypothetical protein